ncbi:molybdate ABC transporter substrate-binding protein [Virgibacillus xinjiangensis]|uniref:Molybdate ABC transporter substrate-binding protein n=1 Tax=Virgibacillus xinjiangensis TaxID=393090 RepID=A0ABV7CWR3_9BACI
MIAFVITLLFVMAGWKTFMDVAPDGKTELTVSAASSMMDSLMEVKEAFEKEEPQIDITYNFGGSGTLRRQIEQGAPIDVFFSASKREYTRLDEAGMIVNGIALLQNRLAVVVPEGAADRSFDDFVRSERKLALGTPKAVPAGTYAQEALEKRGDWAPLEDRIVFAKDATHVLTLVEKGSVGAGIVYMSDIQDEQGIRVLEEIDETLHTPIEYTAAVIGNREGQDEHTMTAAKRFLKFVQSEESMETFRRYGFEATSGKGVID